MKCGHKVEAPDETVVDYDVCVEDGSKSCCASNKDCVSASTCYKYVAGSNPPTYNIQTNDLVCSGQNTWCPKGFKWDALRGVCTPVQKACYSPNPTPQIPCNIPDPLTPKWFRSTGDMGCILNPNAQDMACCVTNTIAGINFYQWAPYTVY